MIHMSESDYRRMTGQPKRNKYNARRVQMDGIWFDSQAERDRYAVLLYRQKAGEISELRHHERFLLIPKAPGRRATYYEADFTYIEAGHKVIEDVKSRPTRTAVYKLKKRLMEEKGYEVKEVCEK
jgi:arylamine N-acetyltransferase